ncbi:MAG: hypothetical protein RLY86_20 [Pseudomonadota bacterium]|jgi:hypothetical protein
MTPGLIGIGITEAESLSLSGGYRIESIPSAAGGRGIRAGWNDGGTASGTFIGPAGGYDLAITWANEDDGAAAWALRVNGAEIAAWQGLAGPNLWERQTIPVTLNPGDMIALSGHSDGGEFARIDRLELTPAQSHPQAAPPSPPQSPPQPAAAVDAVAFLGQSNASGHFFVRGGDGSGGPTGSRVFAGHLQDLLGTGPVTTINAAVSGSGSNQFSHGRDYWWDVAADQPGPLLLDAVRTIRGRLGEGRDLDVIIWAQGETDARAIADDGGNAAAVLARFGHATRQVMDHLRAEFGDIPILVQELGRFPQDGGWLDGPVGALDRARAVQADIIADLSHVHAGAATGDAGHHDSIHFSNAGYGLIGVRLAETVADLFGAGGGV